MTSSGENCPEKDQAAAVAAAAVAKGSNRSGATGSANRSARPNANRASTRFRLRPPPPTIVEDDKHETSSGEAGTKRVHHQPKNNSNNLNDNLELEYGYLDANDTDDLAKAVMVANCSMVTEEDDCYIPTGVEFDPDAKEKALKRSMRRCYMVLTATVVVVAVVLGTTLGLKRGSKDEDDGEGNKKPYREKLGIREALQNATGFSFLPTSSTSTDNNNNDPYQKALEWIIHTDPSEPLPEDPNFLQRFALASIYFATSVDQQWAWCAPPTPYSGDDCLFYRMNVFYPEGRPEDLIEIAGHRWLSGPHECTWVGIMCDGGDQKTGNIQQIRLGTS